LKEFEKLFRSINLILLKNLGLLFLSLSLSVHQIESFTRTCFANLHLTLYKVSKFTTNFINSYIWVQCQPNNKESFSFPPSYRILYQRPIFWRNFQISNYTFLHFKKYFNLNTLANLQSHKFIYLLIFYLIQNINLWYPRICLISKWMTILRKSYDNFQMKTFMIMLLTPEIFKICFFN
jgi:hypothetical protein